MSDKSRTRDNQIFNYILATPLHTLYRFRITTQSLRYRSAASERHIYTRSYRDATLMSPSTAASGDGSRQNAAPNRSHKSPERSRGGRPRRTLIESACTACQRRKSRVSVTHSSLYSTKCKCTDCCFSVMESGKSRLRTGYLAC